MSASQRYLGARTALGIIHIAGCVYNPEAVVRAKDGGTRPYRLPFLVGHGLELATADGDTEVQSTVQVQQVKR